MAAPVDDTRATSPTPDRDDDNVFDDQNEIDDDDDLYAVADGYRPTDTHDGNAQSHDPDDLIAFEPAAEPSTSAFAPSSPLHSASRSRNSIRKVRPSTDGNPFASPEDPAAPLERTTSGNFAPGHAFALPSASSALAFGQTGSPRFGSSGPSFPYGMYPQGTAPRSPSIATTSLRRPSRQSALRGGPQHPYTLYPQGVSDELDDDDDDDDEGDADVAPQNPLPLGFLGLGTSYQRRLGPDGEEQDIIGDYGHAEQLPPYTRYPEAGPEKAPLLAAPTPLHSRAPVLGSDPANPLMHDRIQAEPQSMSDRANLLQRQSTRSSTLAPFAGASAADLSLTESAGTKKSWNEKTWREKRKTRFCGIPLGYYILALGTMSFIIVVLGATIGAFVENGHKNHDNSAVFTVTSLLYDASVIPTPADASTPPTGSFKLSLSPPKATQSACVPAGQRPAWSCNLADANGLAIFGSTDPNGQPGAELFYPDPLPSYDLCYGAQASQMWTNFSQFTPVKDDANPAQGPAYYYQQRYDKWVVVPEDAFSSSFKRDLSSSVAGWTEDVIASNAGDKPWFCFWNQTLLEVWVYIHRPVTITAATTSTTTPYSAYVVHTSAATTSASSTSSTMTSSAAPTTSAAATILTTTIALTTTTYTYQGPASSFGQWSAAYLEEDTSASSTPATTAAARHRRNPVPVEEFLVEDFIHSNDGYYPLLVKIEERRTTDSPTPYCVQMDILNDGSWGYATDTAGDQIIVYLDETDPDYAAYQSKGIADRDVPADSVAGACHCQWISGLGDKP